MDCVDMTGLADRSISGADNSSRSGYCHMQSIYSMNWTY